MQIDGDYIDTAEAAHILGVTIWRVHQYIREPCPDCGLTEYRTLEDGAVEITQRFSAHGCNYCHGTGRRLPTYGRFAGSNKWRLRREDVVGMIDSRTPGYPKGRKRRKK